MSHQHIDGPVDRACKQMAKRTGIVPRENLDLVVDVMIKAKDLTDAELAACEAKAYAAAHRAAADYVKGVLASRCEPPPKAA
jgi:hypothetical protein